MACLCRSGFEGVNNGMMAAAPGLPLWQNVVQILEDRAVPTGDKWKDAPIFQTGPNVLTTVCGSGALRAPAQDLVLMCVGLRLQASPGASSRSPGVSAVPSGRPLDSPGNAGSGGCLRLHCSPARVCQS